MEDHAEEAIQGSKTKREPRLTPRILPDAGVQRRDGEEGVRWKRLVPERAKICLSVPGSQASTQRLRDRSVVVNERTPILAGCAVEKQ